MIAELDQQIELFQQQFKVVKAEVSKVIVGYDEIIEGVSRIKKLLIIRRTQHREVCNRVDEHAFSEDGWRAVEPRK